jgi:hypothetical protein
MSIWDAAFLTSPSSLVLWIRSHLLVFLLAISKKDETEKFRWIG